MTDENVKEILACIIKHIRPDGSFSYFQHKEVEKMKEWLIEFAKKRLDEEATKGGKDMTEQINNDIKVGDEIRTGIEGRNAINSVVHLIGNRGDCLVYHHTCTSNDDIRKTGRHFPQIAEVLKEMQSETALGG